MYRLKKGQESFEIVDGPGEGRKFLRGRVYDGKTIPQKEAWRFEPVPKPAPDKAPVPDKTPAAGKAAPETVRPPVKPAAKKETKS